ncbi:MAG: class I SAM-dependent methyltransferase [Anaerolineales bacterium]
MKPALDPTIDYKRLVAEGYNTCAEAYEQARRQTAHPEIKWLKNQLPNQAHVLDIGCGSGLPVTRELAKRFIVTGVDISAEQIRRARQNVPHAEFLHSDIMTLDFPAASFDAAVALYSIFHLPRGEHGRLFRNIRRWLKPGGYLLATLASKPEEAYTQEDFFGTPMYWSNYGMSEYRAMLAEAGFEILSAEKSGHGYSLDMPEESHPLVICRAGL